MKKIFTLFSAMLFAAGVFAATEQAWYNDVTSIAANGQYYIYSVNGKAFMKAGQAKVQSITTSNYTNASTFKFKISKADQGYVTNGSYYVKSYMELGGSGSNSGPVCTKQSDNGTKIIWTSMNSGEYWNIHGYYNAWFADRYPALKYESDAYEGYMSGSGVSYSKTKDTQTETKFRWYLVSQAQLDRHFAIYFFDAYKETLNVAQYENKIPAAYYTALTTAYGQTFDVKNAAHSADVVNQAKADLETLYTGAAALVEPYATALAAINTLAAVEDKGEDFAEVTTDINNASAALEQAMTVDAINAAVANLKAIDPITFNVTTFEAISSVNGAASSAAGRTIAYDAADKAVINAEGMAIYAGTTKLTATAAATAEYYKFVRSAQVTVTAPTTYGDFEATTCDEEVIYNEKTYTETTVEDVKVGLNYMGGDSIVHVNVTINHASFSFEEKTIVVGAQETWRGIDLSTYAVGVYDDLNDVITNVAGCDSIITLTLTVTKQPTVELEENLEICAGDSVEYRGVWYAQDTTTVLNIEGELSDTTINVTVTVNPNVYENIETSVLSGHDIELPEGDWVIGEELVSGTYPTVQSGETTTLTFFQYGHTEKGCEDVKELTVTVESNTEAIDNVFVNEKAEKILRNGTLYIRRGDAIFTTTGERVE